MKAVKGNKVYTIDDALKKRYQDDGYDITDDSGNVVAYGRGKTVPYETYMAVVKERDELKAKLDAQNESKGNDVAESDAKNTRKAK